MELLTSQQSFVILHHDFPKAYMLYLKHLFNFRLNLGQICSCEI